MLFGSDDILYATLEIIIAQTNVRNKKKLKCGWNNRKAYEIVHKIGGCLHGSFKK